MAHSSAPSSPDDNLPEKTPPGPDGLPILGHARKLGRDPPAFFEEMSQYGDVVSYRLPRLSFVTVLHPALIERVLVSEADRFQKWGFEEFGGEFAPEGLLLTDGEQWRRQRTAIQNVFTLDRIHGYAETMTDAADGMARRWENGQQIAVNDAFSELTLEVLCQSLFDLELDEETAIVRRFASTVNDRANIDGLGAFVPMWIPTPRNRRYRRRLHGMRSFVDGLIEERRDDPEPEEDLMSVLLSAEDDLGREMADTEVRDNLITFLFAGHETTALALTYTVLEIAKHDDVRERLDNEWRTVLGGEPPTLEDLEALTYTERVIREALRLYPPAFNLYRQAREDLALDGYRIPEGTRVTLPQFHVHTDERWWDEPDRFDPERFHAERAADRPDYAYFPFGGGPRHCIGMRFAMLELKTILPTLGQRFDFVLESDPDPELEMATTLRPAEDVLIRLVAR